MSLQHIWFLDIETVPAEKTEAGLNIFAKRFKREIAEYQQHNHFGSMDETFKLIDRATSVHWDNVGALHSEFGKIVCISLGKMAKDKLYIKTFCGRHEDKLLTDFAEAITQANNPAHTLCAHNGREFDFPYIYRRMIINNVPVPEVLNVAGKKPWEIPHLDTLEMWSHMQYKHRCSLELLCHVLGVESPKSDMDGSMVGEVYYSMFEVAKDELPFAKEEAVLKRIGNYCSADILAMVNCYCRMKQLSLVKPENVIYVEDAKSE